MSPFSTILRKLSGVGTATIAQATQSAANFMVTMLAARMLGLEALGLFSLLYGSFILATGIISGFVGDSLMVLDRFNARTRTALFGWALVLLLFVGAASLGCSLLGTGFSLGSAALYALAAISYVAEDLVRRNHMATLTFARIVAMDMVVLVAASGMILGTAWRGTPSLETFLIAIIIGQTAGLVLGWVTLPRAERQWTYAPAAWRAVAGYGIWRSALQALRPGQLTLNRLLIIAVVSLSAAGSLEATRIYAAPAMLVVSGVCSYLFASMARRMGGTLAEQLRETDKAVLRLGLVTVACAVIGVAVLPWGGPLITGHALSALAVTGWLAYALAVAMATPYGLLASVLERARAVFAVRLLDTLLSLALVAAVIVLTSDYRWVPWAAALGSMAGGYAIRRWVLGTLIREASDGYRTALGNFTRTEDAAVPGKEERFS
ncbi:hypothetical protein ACTXPG_12435 [Glutamicibacter arilaitensis]|uniref:hypothetical protein n=1 Tax=Glutamicibacter arilaitensis TaxID=256701 RepID=UPI003FD15983